MDAQVAAMWTWSLTANRGSVQNFVSGAGRSCLTDGDREIISRCLEAGDSQSAETGWLGGCQAGNERVAVQTHLALAGISCWATAIGPITPIDPVTSCGSQGRSFLPWRSVVGKAPLVLAGLCDCFRLVESVASSCGVGLLCIGVDRLSDGSATCDAVSVAVGGDRTSQTLPPLQEVPVRGWCAERLNPGMSVC